MKGESGDKNMDKPTNIPEKTSEELAAGDNPADNQTEAKPKKRRKKALIIVACVLAFLIVAAGVTFLVLYERYKYLGQNPLSAFQSQQPEQTPDESEVPDPTLGPDDPTPVATPTQTPVSGQVNIMLIGLDRSDDRSEENMGARNDTNIVLSVNFDKKTAKMLAIPRDTLVTMSHLNSKGKATYKFWSNMYTGFRNGGGEKGYGYKNIMQVTSKLLSCGNKYSVPINYYVSIDIDGIVPMCDAVGGVPVTMDANFPGPDKVLNWKKGQTVLLKGDWAQFYLRWRHSDEVGDHTGDIGRGHRQQVFLVALAKKIKEMGPVETVQKLFGEMTKYMRTNMSLEQLVALAETLKDMDISTVDINSVDGHLGSRDGKSGWVPESKKLQKKVDEIFFN